MKVVIIGGVAGGATAAARIRRLDEQAEIVVFERSGYISYANCGLPYYIGGVISAPEALTLQTPESFFSRFRVNMRVRHEVTAIHPDRKTVSVQNLETGEAFEEPYDKLLLSPGAKPTQPRLPGAGLERLRQWHSIDVIISELVCIFCWCNPFAWLMKREIRTNLEYMADARVLENGYDSKTYQYHLLGLSHQKAAATIYNSFNVLPLKKRIKMMNKKRTKEIGRTKYLMFLPLAALLMIVSNIEAVARTTKKIAAEVIEAVDAKTGQAVPEVQAPQVAPLPEQDTKTVTYKGKVVDKDTLDNPIFEVVEHMPEFPDGGMSALMEYLSKNIKYPEAAMKKGTQGRATVQFVVEKDGSITNVKILRGIDPELNKEAVRVISAMPKWKPGTQKGEAVRVKYTVPVMFRLTENNTQVKYAPIESKIDEMVVVGYAPEEATYPEEVTVFEVVEKMPEYPGGMSAMMEFIGKNIKYPVAAQKAKTQGRVVIQFIVDKEGNIICPRVIRGADPLLDAEAIRLTTIMPKWKPGMQRGQAVNVKYTVPIMFRLQEPEKSPAVQNATVTPTK